MPNALTTLWAETVSSAKPLRLPETEDWARNSVKLFFAIKAATNSESGVTRMTISVMAGLTQSISAMVPRMVTTPEKKLAKP